MLGSLLNFVLGVPSKFLAVFGISLGHLVVALLICFALYCVWCLWLGAKITAEAKRLDVQAHAEWLVFGSWFRSILVRLHFAKPRVAPVQAQKLVATVVVASKP